MEFSPEFEEGRDLLPVCDGHVLLSFHISRLGLRDIFLQIGNARISSVLRGFKSERNKNMVDVYSRNCLKIH